MEKKYNRVYCKGILGVKTNTPDFRWVYGSAAPETSEEAYEACAVKFQIQVKPERELTPAEHVDSRFQAFSWDRERSTLSYRRTLPLKLSIGYNLTVTDNIVFAEIGKNYYKLIKNRTMNLHGMYYLLSDLANILLLKNGFLTLYASAVHYGPGDKGVVCFAPPNTGKTLTATGLCRTGDYKLVGEDIVITDGVSLYACPWTNSYRTGSQSMDSAGAVRSGSKPTDIATRERCAVTELVALSLAEGDTDTDKQAVFHRICTLNGYLFQYYSSPIVKILGYFSRELAGDWNRQAEDMLRRMVDSCNCYGLRCKTPGDFQQVLKPIVSGERV